MVGRAGSNGNDGLVMRIIRHPLHVGGIIHRKSGFPLKRAYKALRKHLLLFKLSQLGFHFFEVWVQLPFRVRERLFDHQELVQFVCDVEVSMLHLEWCQSPLNIAKLRELTSGTKGG